MPSLQREKKDTGDATKVGSTEKVARTSSEEKKESENCDNSSKNQEKHEENGETKSELPLGLFPKTTDDLKRRRSQSKVEETKHKENGTRVVNSPAGGIAAMIVAAALNKNRKPTTKKDRGKWRRDKDGRLIRGNEEEASDTDIEDEGAEVSLPPTGGIAVMASATALQNKKDKKGGEDASPLGGIAALATAVALKKKGGLSPTFIPAVGGIAAMASAAALKKGKCNTEDDMGRDNFSFSAGKPGGMKEITKESEKSQYALPFVTSRGVAAATEKEKYQANSPVETSKEKSNPPTGGIASMAAAAAMIKLNPRSMINKGDAPTGGIAAMVATAAAEKQNKLKIDKGSAPAGGIAVMAAAAAPRKQMNNGHSHGEVGRKESISTAGGIAAMAAAVALKKQRTYPQNEDGGSGLGVAAMAAAAALRKQRNHGQSHGEDCTKESIPPAGGIAATAAAAALKKQRTYPQNEDRGSGPAAGGIAAVELGAMAADAVHATLAGGRILTDAVPRQQGINSEIANNDVSIPSISHPLLWGIADAAATAAQQRMVLRPDGVLNQEYQLKGGIAATAAAAAQALQ